MARPRPPTTPWSTMTPPRCRRWVAGRRGGPEWLGPRLTRLTVVMVPVTSADCDGGASPAPHGKPRVEAVDASQAVPPGRARVVNRLVRWIGFIVVGVGAFYVLALSATFFGLPWWRFDLRVVTRLDNGGSLGWLPVAVGLAWSPFVVRNPEKWRWSLRLVALGYAGTALAGALCWLTLTGTIEKPGCAGGVRAAHRGSRAPVGFRGTRRGAQRRRAGEPSPGLSLDGCHLLHPRRRTARRVGAPGHPLPVAHCVSSHAGPRQLPRVHPFSTGQCPTSPLVDRPHRGY